MKRSYASSIKSLKEGRRSARQDPFGIMGLGRSLRRVNSEKTKIARTIGLWHDATRKETLILWEGLQPLPKKAPLDRMDTDASGNSLDLQILPLAEGSYPTLKVNDTLMTSAVQAATAIVIEGWLLGADESMGASRLIEGQRNPKKALEIMFVRRKPEQLEFKNIGDAQTGMILYSEITQGDRAAKGLVQPMQTGQLLQAK